MVTQLFWQEYDEKHKRGVTCTGCSREELAAVKGTPFTSAGAIKVHTKTWKGDKESRGLNKGQARRDKRNSRCGNSFRRSSADI